VNAEANDPSGLQIRQVAFFGAASATCVASFTVQRQPGRRDASRIPSRLPVEAPVKYGLTTPPLPPHCSFENTERGGSPLLTDPCKLCQP
jgi:hypothetical protein